MIMHQPVSLIPCLHTYCGGCFADWMTRSKECPNCRKPVMMVNKNAQTNSTIESYLLINPQMKRDPLEIEELEKKNIFKNEVVSTLRIFKCFIFYSSWLTKPNQQLHQNKFHSPLQQLIATHHLNLNLKRKRKSRSQEEELNLLTLEKLQHPPKNQQEEQQQQRTQ